MKKCVTGRSVRSVATVLLGKLSVVIKLELDLFLPKATTPCGIIKESYLTNQLSNMQPSFWCLK